MNPQHSQYSGEPNYNNDIAILHLCQPLTLIQGIQIHPADPAQKYEGVSAIIAGWGVTTNTTVCTEGGVKTVRSGTGDSIFSHEKYFNTENEDLR